MLFFLLINVNIYEQEKFNAQLKFYNLGAWFSKTIQRNNWCHLGDVKEVNTANSSGHVSEKVKVGPRQEYH